MTRTYIVKTKADSTLTRIFDIGGIPEIVWGPGCDEDAIRWMAIKGMEFTPIKFGNCVGFCERGEDWDTETFFLVHK